MVGLAGQFGENHPPRLVHVPMLGRARALEDRGIRRLEQLGDLLQTAGQRPLRDRKIVHLQHPDDAIQRHPMEVFVQHNLNPETAREHPLGNQLRWTRRGNDPRNRFAVARRPITFTFVDTARQPHFPIDFLRVLRAGEIGKRLSAIRAEFLVLGQVMIDFFGRKPRAWLSPIALGPGLLAAPAPRGLAPVGPDRFPAIASVPLAFARVFALLRLASEQLLLHPHQLRLQRLILFRQLHDFGLRTP